MTVVADDDWMRAVTMMPVRTPMKRFFVMAGCQNTTQAIARKLFEAFAHCLHTEEEEAKGT